MAKFLYVWELGAGLGHLSPMSPIFQRLLDAGHEIHVAIRSLEKAHLAFQNFPIVYWQAPIQSAGAKPIFQPPATLAHILANTCFRDNDELASRMKAWDNLIRAVDPDLVILDHAPSALLALEAFSIPRIIMGTGFTVPPDSHPFPNWRPELNLTTDQLLRDELWLLDRLNRWRQSRDSLLTRPLRGFTPKLSTNFSPHFPNWITLGLARTFTKAFGRDCRAILSIGLHLPSHSSPRKRFLSI